ncbi:hypothetical protein [Merismopedia glauca]|uniref:Uncharacterized protein n=1 Tax=Merismopedia glauca CCAP 1448/3 TaxID=1296344 RepID=A0A2T1C8D1_9CYAN|nr:hypothetical protein [Merismopedia glauca]PSB04491.1 hypothetical protein C7B64_03470 [Merismopedia glauca CCAP 1448/3]
MKIIEDNQECLILNSKYPVWQIILLAVTGIPSCLFLLSFGLLIHNLICVGVASVVLVGVLYFLILFTQDKTYDFDIKTGTISIHRKYLFTNLLAKSLEFPKEIVTGIKITISDGDEDYFYQVNLILASTHRQIYLASYSSDDLVNAQNIVQKIASVLQIPILDDEEEKAKTTPYIYDWKQRELEIENQENSLSQGAENPQTYLEIGLLIYQQPGRYNRRRATLYLQEAEDSFLANNQPLLAAETKVLKTLMKWNYPLSISFLALL